MEHRFQTDATFLNSKLFSPERKKFGIDSSLNVHYLPDFMQFVKLALGEQQLLCLVEYQLESFLMELVSSRSAQIDQIRTVEALRQHVLQHIRKSGSFWERNSMVWNRIHGIVLDQQENMQAINEYLLQTGELAQQERQTFPLPLSVFNIKRERLATQNYDTFNHFSRDTQYLRLSPAILAVLKQHLLELELCDDQQKLQYLIVDLVLTAARVRRRKKNFSAEEIEQLNPSAGQLLARIGKETFGAAVAEDPNVDQIVLTNVINCWRRINLENELDPTSNFEELVATIGEEIWEPEVVAKVMGIWLSTFQQQRQHIEAIQKLEQSAKSEPTMLRGCRNTAAELQEIHKAWTSMQEDPSFMKLSHYKYHGKSTAEWAPEDYKKLLEGLLRHFDQTVNNKKIAQYISADLDSNHVKHVKGNYLRNLKMRMDNGECGGGEFGECRSKKEFIQRDLDNFNVKWFAKGRKPARRRKRLADSDEEVESSWECR